MVLAPVAFQNHPSRIAVLLAVLAVGIGNALDSPAWRAMGPRSGASFGHVRCNSLNSAQMNAARVVGSYCCLLYATTGAGRVFALIEVTCLLAVVSNWMVRIAGLDHPQRPERLAAPLGWEIARRVPGLVPPVPW